MDARTLGEAISGLYGETPDAVVFYDRRGMVAGANAAALLLGGYTEEEMRGTAFRDHMAAEDAERIELAARTALAGGTDRLETGARRKDGSTVPVECDVFAAVAAGEIVGFFSQSRDIVALRSAEESLAINQQRFRSLFEYHPDGIVELKGNGSISRVNVGFERETEYYGEQVVGKNWTELIAPECRAAAAGRLSEALAREASEFDSLLLARLGNRIDVQVKLVPLEVANEVRGVYAIFKNVTAQKRAERAIAVQSEQIRRLYLVAATQTESLDDQIDATLSLGCELFGWDQAYVAQFQRERVLIANAAGESRPAKGTIYPLQASLVRHLSADEPQLFVPDMDVARWHDDPSRATAPWRSYFAIALAVAGDIAGALVFAGRSPRDAMDLRERDLMQLMGLFISAALEREQQNERIERMAFNDSLTGLPNRALFHDRIENALAAARRYARGFAVMYVDIDKFKEINDGFGHAAGDAVLKEVARRLRAALRESDTVSRFGGDEFVILQPVVDGPGDAAELARKLILAMQDPIAVENAVRAVRISIGIALYPADAATIDGLMEASDRALYRAKREGRNRWCFADADLARRGLKKGAAVRADAVRRRSGH
ncbi:MAG: diguanylate cyclase [Candidatus Eremiobacteraeota bacterium]|nr:diguanylate cyclase [Candidatus Eremiobacteraeota bacterium]